MEVIEKEFQKHKSSEQVPVNNANITEQNKKNLLIEFYNHCFSGGGKKNLITFYDLGAICKKFGENFCIKEIYNEKYKKEDLTNKKMKNKKSEIQKNLKGSVRFNVFADRLPSGVYQHVNIHITYFVKISNDKWSEFVCGRKRNDDISDDESDEVNGNNFFLKKKSFILF